MGRKHYKKAEQKYWEHWHIWDREKRASQPNEAKLQAAHREMTSLEYRFEDMLGFLPNMCLLEDRFETAARLGIMLDKIPRLPNSNQRGVSSPQATPCSRRHPVLGQRLS